jgi:hypothetical protein
MAARTVGPVTTASATGLAAAVCIVWGFETASHVDVPELVENAFALLLTVAGGYLVKRGDHAA